MFVFCKRSFLLFYPFLKIIYSDDLRLYFFVEYIQSSTVQGTVPYLGTFLTDLMMIDSALKDTADDKEKLINFDKRRKEFEILTQIKLWQSAAGLYRFVRDPEFHRRFNEQKVLDESERLYWFLECNHA